MIVVLSTIHGACSVSVKYFLVAVKVAGTAVSVIVPETSAVGVAA
jgi:hypothetical protein